MKSLNCLTNLILYQTFRTILNTRSKSIKFWMIRHPFRYTWIEFRTELYLRLKLNILSSWCQRLWKYLEVLTKIKDVEMNKTVENVPCLEKIEVVLVRWNISSSIFVPNKPCGQQLHRNIFQKEFVIHLSTVCWSKLQITGYRKQNNIWI